MIFGSEIACAQGEPSTMMQHAAVIDSIDPNEHSNHQDDINSENWCQQLARLIATSDPSVEKVMSMSMACDTRSGNATFYLPQDTGHVHARCLRYLKSFAAENGLKLGRDRRGSQQDGITELRNGRPPLISLALSLLLKQTGVPGAARTLSKPHALADGTAEIGLRQLILMAAFSAERSKCVVVLPNRILINALQDTQPIRALGCKLKHAGGTTLQSQFDSPHFRALGYSAGSQYIVHICLAGGQRGHSALWTRLPVVNNMDINFQLFPGKSPADDQGLFYLTFYFDMTEQPAPWWIEELDQTDSSSSSEVLADTHTNEKS